jgi:prevent-host-death family protein
MPQVISATDAKNQFSELVNRVVYNGEEFVVQKQGKPVVLITHVNQSHQPKPKKFTTNDFLTELTKVKAENLPADLGRDHDKYAWD